jgi:hypothetical protein
MNRNTFLGIWSWLVVATVLEVIVAYSLSSSLWYIRGGIEIVIALSAAVPLTLYYMGVLREHIGLKMFLLVALFFSIDLVLIWTASLVH